MYDKLQAYTMVKVVVLSRMVVQHQLPLELEDDTISSSVWLCPPPQLALPADDSTPNAAVEDCLQQRKIMNTVLQEALLTAQHRIKQYADEKQTEREFKIGDWVYLKLQPYRQSSVEIRRNLKLAAKFFGPYKVLEKVGAVAYRLQLPSGSKVHPVFHVSQLKPKLGQHQHPLPNLPLVDPNGQMRFEPLQILDRRLVKRNNRAITQVLVEWSNSVPEDATWEDYQALKQQFPSFDP